MPLNAAIVGVSTAPVVHTIDARWLTAYAAGLGEMLPCYLDTRRPEGIQAHPLFPVYVEWPAVLALRDQAGTCGLTPEEALRSVHATHDLVIHRSCTARRYIDHTCHRRRCRVPQTGRVSGDA